MKIISGGQTGVDIAALEVAKEYGIETGGWMPPGWITQIGAKPQYESLYGLKEHPQDGYKPRTWQNVFDSDATIRLAFNFKSPGEICTLNAIKKYNKPYYDIDMANPVEPNLVLQFLLTNKVSILNVAGNSEKSANGIYIESKDYLKKLFKLWTEI